MRQIFNDVPVIYGFTSVAPLGPVAGTKLDRYFRTAGVREVGRGRPSSRLVEAFAAHGMRVAAGIGEHGALADARADMCRFADERLGTAAKLSFLHELLQRHVGEARLHLERIQRLAATLDETTRRQPAVARALEDIARDSAAKVRLLDYARGTDPSVRVRLLNVAKDLSWLSASEHRDALAAAMRDVHSRAVGVSEVNLSCSLNRDNRLDGAISQRAPSTGPADDVPHAAMRACLGSKEDRARTLRALLGPHEVDVRIAQTYLRHRPITVATELREMAEAIAHLPASATQVRALEALARHYVADREVLVELLDLFSTTPSAAVQSAIAGILIRADRRALQDAELMAVLTRDRRPAPRGGDGMIDALIRTLHTQ